jgi:hypothetical protein
MRLCTGLLRRPLGYVRDSKRVYTAEQLETTIRRLDERCRVVEF